MNTEHPKAQDELIPLDRPFTSEIPKYRKIVAAKGLSGLANDTKWNELLQRMRARDVKQWCPGFRFQCLGSDHISRWDAEWWHHLPFPFISVSWFDLSYREEITIARLLPTKTIDHSAEIETLLSEIGFDFEKGAEAMRIFGYAPRDYTDFKKEPNQALRHNDPSCHVPCLRTYRASRGRG